MEQKVRKSAQRPAKSGKKPVPAKTPPFLEIEEARHAIEAAKSFVDIAIEHVWEDVDRRQAELRGASSVLKTLRSQFPAEWGLPKLTLKIEDPLWGGWDDVWEEVLGAINTQITLLLRKHEAGVKQRQRAAKKNRTGRYPTWMKSEAEAFFLRGCAARKPPTIGEVENHLAKLMHQRPCDEADKMPSHATVGDWIRPLRGGE